MGPYLRICLECKRCYGHGLGENKVYCKECSANCQIIKQPHNKSHGLCDKCFKKTKNK